MILFVTTLCSNNNFIAHWNKKKNVLLHKYYQIYYITNEQFLY